MSIISSIRNSIALLIAADRQPVRMIVDNSKALTIPNTPAHILSQHERAEKQALVAGKFYVQDLTCLNSERARDAIASLGCWSALARGFSEYERVTGKKNLSDAKLSILVDEFHAWNASSSAHGYMTSDQLFEAVAKMAVVSAPKGSAETDAILARVKKVSVEQIRADRLKKAEAQTAKRIDMLDGFVALIEGSTGGTIDYHAMSSAKALDKAMQTLEWVAGWDSNNPAEQAAELLMIEDDIKLIRELAKVEKDNGQDYEEGVMATDTLDKNINALDHGRRAGESAKGHAGYEPEPMEKVAEELAALDEAGHRPARRRIPKAA